MSTESDVTQYGISIFIGNQSNTQINLYASDGFTDEMVAGIYEALIGATWPQAVTPGGNISVFKSGQANTSYNTDYQASPVTFS